MHVVLGVDVASAGEVSAIYVDLGVVAYDSALVGEYLVACYVDQEA